MLTLDRAEMALATAVSPDTTRGAAPHSGVTRDLGSLSVVVPLCNEEGVVPVLCDRLAAVLGAIGAPFEIVAVDDGSRDETRARLLERQGTLPQLRVVCLSRNFGLQGAVAAGLMHARGEAVVLMDGDLQDPPELIPQLIDEWRAGAEVVYTIKRSRQERGLRRVGMDLFHLLYRRIAYVPLPATSGNFSLFDRRVLLVLNGLPEQNRFLPGLRTWVGFRQVAVEFERADRSVGQPSMTMRRLARLAFDGIVGFSHLPIRAVSILGLLACGVGVGLVAWVLVERFITHTAILGWPSLMIAISLLGGAQLVSVGVLGEYVMRIFDEVRRRPNFIVDQVVQQGDAMRPLEASDLSRPAAPGFDAREPTPGPVAK